MFTHRKYNEEIKVHNKIREKMRNSKAEEREKLLQRLRLHSELFARTHRFGAFTNWAKVHLDALFMSTDGASTYIGKEGFCSIAFPPCPFEERFAELPEEKGPIAEPFDLDCLLSQFHSTSPGENPFGWKFG
jgi:hypothetical protein